MEYIDSNFEGDHKLQAEVDGDPKIALRYKKFKELHDKYEAEGFMIGSVYKSNMVVGASLETTWYKDAFEAEKIVDPEARELK